MTTQEQIGDQSSMSKVFVFATLVCGFVAAYMMYKRGESLGSIAKQAVTNAVGSFVSEIKDAI